MDDCFCKDFLVTSFSCLIDAPNINNKGKKSNILNFKRNEEAYK